MMFTVRQLQEKYQEQNLVLTFVDLTKAFDTVCRGGLWKIMAKFGSPPRFIAMMRQFHNGMQARVQNDGEFSEHCSAWCFLPCSLTLFRTVTLVYLSGAVFDGNMFNLRRWQAKTKTQTDVLDKLLYAYDMDTNAAQGQKCKETWIKSHNHVITMPYGITISTKRHRLYTNQHMENHTMNQPSL